MHALMLTALDTPLRASCGRLIVYEIASLVRVDSGVIETGFEQFVAHVFPHQPSYPKTLFEFVVEDDNLVKFMELSKQVVSLDLAKRLKELGVKQESYFEWYHRVSKKPEYRLGSRSDWEPSYEDMFASAFTIAELGEMLKRKNWQIVSNYVEDEDDWVCWMRRWESKEQILKAPLITQSYIADAEADARGEDAHLPAREQPHASVRRIIQVGVPSCPSGSVKNMCGSQPD